MHRVLGVEIEGGVLELSGQGIYGPGEAGAGWVGGCEALAL